MNLKTISDNILMANTEDLVRRERELLTEVLHHLREIDRRRLYASYGYKSLFDFASKKLGYPEDQAYRRITAMKLLKEIPEIEEKINSGELTLTHIGLAQSLFRQEKKTQQKEMSRTDKIRVIHQITNKSTREAQKITFALSSEPVRLKPDRISPLSENYIELRVTTNSDVEKKIATLKAYLASTNPNIPTGDLLEKLCDLGLKEWGPSKKFAAPRKRCVDNSKAQIRRNLFSKAENRCENCESQYALEIDHIIPSALGGLSDENNLRLLCRSCNQRSAIQIFGSEKMDQYLN